MNQKPEVFWVNVYPGEAYQIRTTRAECEQAAGSDRVALVRVEWKHWQMDKEKQA